jgi:hypothetical protein
VKKPLFKPILLTDLEGLGGLGDLLPDKVF